ncbi:MAG: hypothetical protein QM770_03890 [Tepidisphaeraceae bacterium]
MRHILFSMLALVGLLSIGCTPVTSSAPIGSPLPADDVAIRETIARLDGAWLIEGDDEHKRAIELRSIGEGDIAVGRIDWEQDAQAFRLVESTAKVRKIGDRYVMNLLAPKEDPKEPDHWELFLLSAHDDQAVNLAPAIAKPFADAVKAGTLAGEVDNEGKDQTVQLTNAEKATALLTKSKLTDFFNEEGCTTLRRLSRARQD